MASIIALSIGCCCMIILSITIGKSIALPASRKILILLFGFATAILGLRVVSFIEHGHWIGFSFFGAHFFAPLGIVIASKLFKVNKSTLGDLLDLTTVSLCAGLASHKVACAIDGCCFGRIIRILEDGSVIRFPSQIVESFVGWITMICLIFWIKSGKQRGIILHWYMIIYGVERFILTFFRETTHTICRLPDGQFWSIISILVGLCLFYIRNLQKATAEEQKAATRNRRYHKAR